MMLRHIFKNDAQFLIAEHLHMVLGGRAVLGQDLGNLLGRCAEVLGDLVHPIFILYCHGQLLLIEISIETTLSIE